MNAFTLVGKQYKTRGKHPKICTVVDEHTTFDKDGRIIKVAYVSEHEFLGQSVTTRDVCRTTILMNEVTAS